MQTPTLTPDARPRLRRPAAYLAALAVTLAGLAVLVLGLQRTTLLGGEVLFGRMPRVTQPIVVTAPGMTELTGTRVQVRAASSGNSEPVFIGIGRATDVEAYLDRAGRTEIIALEQTGVLRLSTVPGEDVVPDPAGVDVWTASARAMGVASLTWPSTPGSWRLVVAVDGRTAPTAAEFTWSGVRGTAAAPAFISVGGVLAVLGLAALLAMRSGRLLAGPKPGPRSTPSVVTSTGPGDGVLVEDRPAHPPPERPAEDDEPPVVRPFRRPVQDPTGRER